MQYKWFEPDEETLNAAAAEGWRVAQLNSFNSRVLMERDPTDHSLHIKLQDKGQRKIDLWNKAQEAK